MDRRQLQRLTHALLLGAAMAAGVLKPSLGLAQAGLEVDVRNDGVYMRVQGRSLAEALQALSRAGGFELKTNDPFAEPVSVRVQGVSMPVAIRRLVRQHSSVLMYGENAQGERVIRELRVYKANQGQPPTAIVRSNRAQPRSRAAGAGGETMDPAKLAELASLLNAGASTRDQRQAITELRGIGGDGAVQALSTAMQLPDKTVRSYAVAVLGQIGSPQAVEILGRTAVSDEEADVRIRAVIALARQHGEQARQFVENSANSDTDDRVREAAQARLNAW